MNDCTVCGKPLGDGGGDLVWRKDGHDIRRCTSCGLLFRADPPDESAVREIYTGRYFRDQPGDHDKHGYADYLRDEPLHRANARRRLALLARRLPRPGRLLDVGCAAGFFVAEARARGWDASGVDVSAEMVAVAQTQLGVPAQQATFRAADLETPLDAVTMWDYIEHSIDPRADLVKVRASLRPGGLLALSTGDVGALTARLSGRRWHLLTPEHHNFFFDERTLRALLETTGFEIVERRHRPALYSSAHLLYKLAALTSLAPLRGAAARIGESRLGSLQLPVNLFDIVTIVARATA